MKAQRIHPRNGLIEQLNADRPNLALKEKLMLFGQFVGDWEISECRYREENRNWIKSTGELHWGWILGGNALQDIWMTMDEET